MYRIPLGGKIQVKLASATVTNKCSVYVSYKDVYKVGSEDYGIGNYTPSQTNGATVVDVCLPAPNLTLNNVITAGIRNVDKISLVNNDTIAHTVTFQAYYKTNPTATVTEIITTIISITISVGDTLQYAHAKDWNVIDVNGNIKVTTGTGGGGGISLIGQTNGIISNPTPSSTFETWYGYLAGANGASNDYSIFMGNQAGDGALTASNMIAIGRQAGLNDAVVNVIPAEAVWILTYSSLTGGTFTDGDFINDSTFVYSAFILSDDGVGTMTILPYSIPFPIGSLFDNTLGVSAVVDTLTYHPRNIAILTCSSLVSTPFIVGDLVGDAGYTYFGYVISDDGLGNVIVGDVNNAYSCNFPIGSTITGLRTGLVTTALVDAIVYTPLPTSTSILIGDKTSTGGYSNSIALGANAKNTAAYQFIVSPDITDATIPYLGGYGVGVVAVDNNGKLLWSAGGGGGTTDFPLTAGYLLAGGPFDGSAPVTFDWVSPLTTKGDLFGFSTTDERIPIGANGYVFMADSTTPLGLKWAALPIPGLPAVLLVDNTTGQKDIILSEVTGQMYTKKITDTKGTSYIQFTDGTGTAPYEHSLLIASPTGSGVVLSDSYMNLTIKNGEIIVQGGLTRLYNSLYVELGANIQSGNLLVQNGGIGQYDAATSNQFYGTVNLGNSTIAQGYLQFSTISNSNVTRFTQGVKIAGVNTATTVTLPLLDPVVGQVLTAKTVTGAGSATVGIEAEWMTTVKNVALPVTSAQLPAPAGNTIYWFGNAQKAFVTTQGQYRVYVPVACTVIMTEIMWYSAGTNGSNENISIYVTANGTDNLVQTVGITGAQRRFSNAAMSVALAAGDYFEIKVVTPVGGWATPPTNINVGGSVYIQY